MARWRRAGYAQTGTLGPGPAWCWLTAAGMSACGLGYPARPPALSRLAHIRAVLAARLWLESGPAYRDGRAWWRSERRLRAALASNAGAAHVADAEIHWPSVGTGPYAGQVWAVEVELTPKPAARTARIMTGLLSHPGYAQVVYLTAPAARPVVARAAAGLPHARRARVTVPGPARGRGIAGGAPVRVMSLLQALAVLWLVRKGMRLARSLAVAAVLAAVWPVTAVAAVSGAWRCAAGCPPGCTGPRAGRCL